MLSKFACSHVGRTNESDRAKAQAFIRVAEIRREQVENHPVKCPECRKRDSDN